MKSISSYHSQYLGVLYAKCPVDSYPGPAVESVKDSSRYFVIRLQNDKGQSVCVGCGFADRSDSFDLNVTLQVCCILFILVSLCIGSF